MRGADLRLPDEPPRARQRSSTAMQSCPASTSSILSARVDPLLALATMRAVTTIRSSTVTAHPVRGAGDERLVRWPARQRVGPTSNSEGLNL